MTESGRSGPLAPGALIAGTRVRAVGESDAVHRRPAPAGTGHGGRQSAIRHSLPFGEVSSPRTTAPRRLPGGPDLEQPIDFAEPILG